VPRPPGSWPGVGEGLGRGVRRSLLSTRECSRGAQGREEVGFGRAWEREEPAGRTGIGGRAGGVAGEPQTAASWHGDPRGLRARGSRGQGRWFPGSLLALGPAAPACPSSPSPVPVSSESLSGSAPWGRVPRLKTASSLCTQLWLSALHCHCYCCCDYHCQHCHCHCHCHCVHHH